VLAEQTDEWTEARRYMGLELLTNARLAVLDSESAEGTDDAASPPESCRSASFCGCAGCCRRCCPTHPSLSRRGSSRIALISASSAPRTPSRV
jgi:succinate dehydrogenase/fumarate reductase-like Fe-S protein